MNETKTYCLGRFLIDVPKESEIAGQGYEFMFGRVNSEKTGIDTKGFATRMTNREAEIKTKKIKNIYQLTKTITPSPESRIFLASRNAFSSIAYGFDAYRVEKNTLFSITQTGFTPDHIDSIISRLQKDLLPAIRTRQPDEIPTEPGFCIENGFIAHDGSDRVFEEARLQFNFKNWPDIWLTIYSRTVAAEGQKTLLQRIDGNPVPAIFASVANQLKTLRKGKHPVSSFPGEDSLDVISTKEGARVHSFTWEAQGKLHDPFNPTLHLDFSTGHVPGNNSDRTRPSLTDDQAIQLFDSIVNSIRVRPTGPANVSATEPSPLFPLGEVIATGTVCPQNGWWKCYERNDDARIKVEGGQRQFFQAGQIMPQAVLVGTPTFWQKLFEGMKPFRHATATAWKLDAYDDATVTSLVATKTDPDKASEV